MSSDSTPAMRALRVFISYAHEDNLMRKALLEHLALLQRERLIEKWDDRQIRGGDRWADAIDANLEAAEIVLLLVSASFLASDYCFEREMSRALQRHAAGACRVIPIILRPCAWETAPFGQLAAFPESGKAISKWEPIDEGFTQVEQGLRRIILEMREAGAEAPPPGVAKVSPADSRQRRSLLLILGAGGTSVALGVGAGLYFGRSADGAGVRSHGEGLPAPPPVAKPAKEVDQPAEPRPREPDSPNKVERPSAAPMPPAPKKARGLYMLSVGVSKYRDQALAQGVPFAAQDAKTVKEHFERIGSKAYRPVYVRGLWDEDATRDRIESEMRDLATRIKPNDIFILYLAGYGAAFGQEYNFIPQEARYINAQKLRDESLGQDRLRKLLAGIDTRNVLVLLDTCSVSGPGEQRAGVGDKDALSQFGSISNRPLIAAAANEQMVQKGEGEHTVFTFALLEGLLGAADANNDDVIEVRELAEYIERRIPEITRRNWNYERFPYSSIKDASFSLLLRPERK